jgi:phosphoribosylaminoimidazole-succinocarboxamide synthase
MSGFDVHRLVEGEVQLAGFPVNRDRLKLITDVVAEIKPFQYPPGEPVPALLQDRQSGGAGPPGATGELVHLVAGTATEQLGQRLGSPRHKVHGHRLGGGRHPRGVVLTRQADQEAWRVDAALAAKSDQATSLPLASAHGDDQHRVLKLPDKLTERAVGAHSDQPTQRAGGGFSASTPAASRLGTVIDMEHVSAGKVRDLYSIDGDLLLVASDRISAYDVVLPTPIPDKGALLTQLSVWWFHKLRTVAPNHLISATDVPPEFQNRAIRCVPLRMIPVECIARGYLAGLGLREYEKAGTVSGVALPAGLVSGSRLPEPIFTPTTKFSDTGHDEFITFDDVIRTLGKDTANRIRSMTVELYVAAAEHALNNGVIVADTKFEFGWDAAGQVTLGDEALTPDSSRFWLAEKWRPGAEQYALDKQFVRHWAASTGWDREPPGPVIPPAIVVETRRRYIEAYERITGVRWTS